MKPKSTEVIVYYKNSLKSKSIVAIVYCKTSALNKCLYIE